MIQIIITPDKVLKSEPPYIRIAAPGMYGGILCFPLNPQSIQELREGADRCEAYLAREAKEAEIRARLEQEMTA